jgi:hypothetical protein
MSLSGDDAIVSELNAAGASLVLALAAHKTATGRRRSKGRSTRKSAAL